MRPPRLPAIALALAAAPVLSACGRAAQPAWVDLAGALRVEVPDGVTRLPWRGGELELHAEDGGVTLRVPLRRESWTFEPSRGAWYAALGLDVPQSKLRGPFELHTPGGPVPHGELERVIRGEPLQGFVYWNGDLAFGGADGPPEEAVLHCPLIPRASGRSEAVLARTFSGAGPLLLSGMRARSLLALPAASTLRFGFAFEPLVRGAEARVTCRVLVDGVELLAETLTARPGRRVVWRALELEARPRAELTLEVGGDLALAAFLDPTLGPREIGRPGARPWDEARPDLLVFLADTFRADNLSAYGGAAGVTPALDALVRESLVFTEARSIAPWTLPAHASLFSGFFPHQVGIMGEGGAVPEEVEMLAESLARAGYRTAALTDAGLVSARYGLGQGFRIFAEEQRELGHILDEARAFLAADDGRPVFLFVQSYRVHWPYHSTAETRSAHGARLGLEGEAGPLLEAAVAEARAQGQTQARRIPDLEGLKPTARFQEIATALRSQYLAGVADLDREVGAFVAELGSAGYFEHGCFLFTSDHGEGFGEHGALFHGRRLHDEQTRIPLFLRGPGIAAGRVEHPVTLVDVAPTLASLAGLALDPRWPGRSLFAAAIARPSYAFECSSRPGASMAVVDDDWKLLLPEDPAGLQDDALLEAYHLATDPRERSDLARAERAEPARLQERHRAAFERWLAPLVSAIAAEIDAEKAAELEHLGY